MIEYDEFGPELIYQVYDSKTGLKGFTVIDNTALGTAKGGIRMTPDVSVEEIFKLARTMTWKNALAELPFGGGKSGIIANPKEFDKKKKLELMAAFGKALRSIAPKYYIAAPDINTAEEEMAAFVKGNGSLKSATGKPKKMKGIPHELGSTGFGVAHATAAAVRHIGLNIKGMTVAIEGFGSVGTFTMKYLSEWGADIIAVSDSKGCIYNDNGLNYNELMRVKDDTGSVINYKPGRIIKNDELFLLSADILIPSAVPDVINERNFKKIKAKIISEGANIPIAPDIEKKLHEKGVLVIPDFVANAGGVISSYVEHIGKKPEYMFKLVESKIKRNTQIVLEHAKMQNISPRDAAMKIAVERVRKAISKRKS